MKSQNLTIKKFTGKLNLKVPEGQPLAIFVNGKEQFQYVDEPVVINPGIFANDYPDLRTAIQSAILQKQPLIIEEITLSNDCIPEHHIIFSGDLIIKAMPGKRGIINFNFRDGIVKEVYGLRFGAGKHHFENIDFVCKQQTELKHASCIQTEQVAVTYHNTFVGCNFIGPWFINYQSSRGLGSSTFDRCDMFATNENIQYYSQDGSKELVMTNCITESVTSHNIYSHPWNSIKLDGLICKGTGKLAFNSYSASPENFTQFQSKYFIIKNCRNAPGVISPLNNGAPMWRLWSIGSKIEMDSCDLPTYEWLADFNIKNSNITNAGNGTAVYGHTVATNCTGSLTAMSTLVLNDCNMNEIKVVAGAQAVVNRGMSGFNYLYGDALFNEVAIGDADVYKDATAHFKDCTFKPQYGAIRAYDGGAVGITFEGNEFKINSY